MIGIAIFLIIAFFMFSVWVAIYEGDVMIFFLAFISCIGTTVVTLLFLGLFFSILLL